MTVDASTIFLLVGAGFIFTAILGGGFEAKEVKIPVLTPKGRLGIFALGVIFFSIGLLPVLKKSLDQFNKTPSEQSGVAMVTAVASPKFGISLIASSTPQLAQQYAIEAQSQSFAPARATMKVFKRGAAWATVVLYPDDLTAGVAGGTTLGTDLPKYQVAYAEWHDAYVVEITKWCPKATDLVLVLPSPAGTLNAIDCHLNDR
jgi:hypothetical protein